MIAPYYRDEASGIAIYHGDCREVLPELGAEAFGVLVTDPPYGMKFVAGHGADSRGSGWTSRWTGVEIAGDATTEVRDWVVAWWGNRPALMFGSWKTAMPQGVREVLVWDKVVSTGMGDLSIPWRPSWEMIYVMGHGFTGPRGHGVLAVALPNQAPDRRWHPTPKPVPLLKKLLAKCPTGWRVIDPFLGAGATLVAAKSLGMAAVGIEIEERYCFIAASRLQQGVLPLMEVIA